MTTDLITQEIAYLLTKPELYDYLTSEGDSIQQVEDKFFERLFSAKREEYGARIDELREDLARVLAREPHAVQLARRSLDARDEYAHRAGRARVGEA